MRYIEIEAQTENYILDASIEYIVGEGYDFETLEIGDSYQIGLLATDMTFGESIESIREYEYEISQEMPQELQKLHDSLNDGLLWLMLEPEVMTDKIHAKGTDIYEDPTNGLKFKYLWVMEDLGELN